jgi:hypothetical protein
MNFQSWELWIINMAVIFYMDFKIVQWLYDVFVRDLILVNNIFKKLIKKVLHDDICKIMLMGFWTS